MMQERVGDGTQPPQRNDAERGLEAPPPQQYFDQLHSTADYHEKASRGRSSAQADFWTRFLVQLMPLAPKSLIWPVANRYVAGDNVTDMVKRARELNQKGCSVAVNILGEFVSATQQAQSMAQGYQEALDAICQHQLDANISLKLSSLGLLIDEGLCRRLTEQVVGYAHSLGNFVRLEMEDTSSTDTILSLYQDVRRQYDNVGVVLQAYLRRTQLDARRLIAEGGGHFRLCKGIYLEPRWLAYQLPELINLNYVAVLDEMMQSGAYVGIATHDERLVFEALKRIDRYGLKKSAYEFQMLMGVDPGLRDMLVAAGHRVRVYVPYGPQWHAYSLRRFKENPKIAGYVIQNLFSGQ